MQKWSVKLKMQEFMQEFTQKVKNLQTQMTTEANGGSSDNEETDKRIDGLCFEALLAHCELDHLRECYSVHLFNSYSHICNYTIECQIINEYIMLKNKQLTILWSSQVLHCCINDRYDTKGLWSTGGWKADVSDVLL